MEDAEVNRKVCFKHKSIGYCYRSVQIKVRNCGSYHIYKLFQPPTCDLRQCGTNWCWGNKLTMSIVQCEMVKSLRCFASARLTHLASITRKFLRKTVASAIFTSRISRSPSLYQVTTFTCVTEIYQQDLRWIFIKIKIKRKENGLEQNYNGNRRYPPLCPLLINMTRDNLLKSLLSTQIFFESWIFSKVRLIVPGSQFWPTEPASPLIESTAQVRDEFNPEYISPLNMTRCIM